LGSLFHPAVSTTLYVILGWLILIAIKPLVALWKNQWDYSYWCLGGVLYYIGVCFFWIDSRSALWAWDGHLFVVVGTVSHIFRFYYGGLMSNTENNRY